MMLSIMGMYESEPSLFDGLNIPTYIDPDGKINIIDKNTVINNICINCAELELLYSSFETMKLAIGIWSAANQETWRKMIETQYIKYNPIWNVDANIEQNRIIERDIDSQSENINAVSGYNSPSWANANKDTGTFNDNEDVHDNFTERRTGNIGVTATQDLIKKQREIAEFNIIDYIAESFKKRFCLMVY